MKKIMSAAAAILAVLFTVTAYASGLGDVNGDGKINVTDAALTAAYVKGLRGIDDFSAADVNSDGKVNVTDVILLTAHTKGLRPLDVRSVSAEGEPVEHGYADIDNDSVQELFEVYEADDGLIYRVYETSEDYYDISVPLDGEQWGYDYIIRDNNRGGVFICSMWDGTWFTLKDAQTNKVVLEGTIGGDTPVSLKESVYRKNGKNISSGEFYEYLKNIDVIYSHRDPDFEAFNRSLDKYSPVEEIQPENDAFYTIKADIDGDGEKETVSVVEGYYDISVDYRITESNGETFTVEGGSRGADQFTADCIILDKNTGKYHAASLITAEAYLRGEAILRDAYTDEVIVSARDAVNCNAKRYGTEFKIGDKRVTAAEYRAYLDNIEVLYAHLDTNMYSMNDAKSRSENYETNVVFIPEFGSMHKFTYADLDHDGEREVIEMTGAYDITYRIYESEYEYTEINIPGYMGGMIGAKDYLVYDRNLGGEYLYIYACGSHGACLLAPDDTFIVGNSQERYDWGWGPTEYFIGDKKVSTDEYNRYLNNLDIEFSFADDEGGIYLQSLFYGG